MPADRSRAGTAAPAAAAAPPPSPLPAPGRSLGQTRPSLRAAGFSGFRESRAPVPETFFAPRLRRPGKGAEPFRARARKTPPLGKQAGQTPVSGSPSRAGNESQKTARDAVRHLPAKAGSGFWEAEGASSAADRKGESAHGGCRKRGGALRPPGKPQGGRRMKAHRAAQLLRATGGIVAEIGGAGDAKAAAARPKKGEGIAEPPGLPRLAPVGRVREAGRAQHRAQGRGPARGAATAARAFPPIRMRSALRSAKARRPRSRRALWRPPCREASGRTAGKKAPASCRPRRQTAPPAPLAPAGGTPWRRFPALWTRGAPTARAAARKSPRGHLCRLMTAARAPRRPCGRFGPGGRRPWRA